jgi:hypothetical protein
LPFSPATQTCCSEVRKELEYFIEEFQASDCHRSILVELWCLSAAMPTRMFDLVFYKILFGNKYYIL